MFSLIRIICRYTRVKKTVSKEDLGLDRMLMDGWIV